MSPDEEYIAAINACLEPSVPEGLRSLDQRRELSIAISLKRIADALAPPAGQHIANSLFYIEQRLGEVACR